MVAPCLFTLQVFSFAANSLIFIAIYSAPQPGALMFLIQIWMVWKLAILVTDHWGRCYHDCTPWDSEALRARGLSARPVRQLHWCCNCRISLQHGDWWLLLPGAQPTPSGTWAWVFNVTMWMSEQTNFISVEYFIGRIAVVGTQIQL